MQIVPNSTLNKEIISNFSRPRPIRMEIIEVGFSYDDPPNKVRKALLEVARHTRASSKIPRRSPRPFAYGDSAINYRLIYRTTEDDRWPVRNELTTRIWYVAKRHGFTIPYPIHVNLEHRQSGPYGKADVGPAELIGRFPRIPSVPAVEGSGGATPLHFAAGETIFEEGDALQGVYLVASGSVSLEVAVSGSAGEIGSAQAGSSSARPASTAVIPPRCARSRSRTPRWC